jgi:succinyl-CoA synthetase beta subunit
MQLTSPAVTQRTRALERANEVRHARAALKSQIARGQRGAADVILTCPNEAARMPISELLRSQPGWGSVRCRVFLNHLSLREDKPVGSLTERQRSTVASLLTKSSSN